MNNSDQHAAGPSGRSVPAAGAPTAAAVAHRTGRAPAASAAAKPAVLHAPRQDGDAIGPTGPIPEHKAAGRPVRLVLGSNGRNPDDVAHRPTNDGTISDVRSHHVHAYERPRDERADGAAYVLNVPGSHMKAKRNAIHACNTWDPSRNPYALGHRSVPEPLEAAHADPREAAHTPPSDHRPGKGN